MKKFLTFTTLIFAAGSFTKIAYLKDSFYIQMQEFMYLTHTQIGLAMSVYGIVQAFGGVVSVYISDRFSKKILIPWSLIGIGITGIYLSTYPAYIGVLICWGLFSLFTEIICWPVILKTIRLLGNKDNQGKIFSFLELGRGFIDVLISFLGLQIFLYLGSNANALKGTIIFYSISVIVIGIISYFLLEDDIILKNKTESKHRIVLQNIKLIIKKSELWYASFTMFCIYSAYCGITYFLPFLKEIYNIPVEYLVYYGIINQYGLKLVGSPLGGYGADKLSHSPIKFIRLLLIIASIIMIIFILLPHNKLNNYILIGIILTLSFGVMIFALRAIYFAQINEINIPIESTGAAMSILCIIGYLPRSFMYTIYGSILDKNNNIIGYNGIFIIMLSFLILGIISASIIVKRIYKKI
ncbi:MFS transporter [Brachyspira sp.]|uniref:MFS transporter n=1 Tax=Brachyspira sp. TaxID=1977261 RepID=UPI00261FA624|nr:MFS transporter [Brachyspira sp.]